MSMHIKSPAGTPDIDIHSVRVKPTTATKTVTANGTYNASTDGVDGYSAVTVAVAETVPSQKINTAQGGWRPVGADGYIYPERYDGTDPEVGAIRCCLPTYVYNLGGSAGQISCTGSGIMANIRDLTFAVEDGKQIVKQNNVTNWLSMPVSLASYSADTPLCVTFKKTDGTQAITPSDIGTVTIA